MTATICGYWKDHGDGTASVTDGNGHAVLSGRFEVAKTYRLWDSSLSSAGEAVVFRSGRAVFGLLVYGDGIIVRGESLAGYHGDESYGARCVAEDWLEREAEDAEQFELAGAES